MANARTLINIYDLWVHETKRHISIRYVLALLVFIAYSIFVINKYGSSQGILISLLTWSFFVLCTPIADAGLILDLPIRLLTGIKMIYAEIIVWVVAVGVNIYTAVYSPQIYENTILLTILYQIITNPFPLWSIIVLSFIGTFMSIYFGDELLDVVFHHEREKYHKHHLKLKIVSYLTTIMLVVFLYQYLLTHYGIKIV